MDATFPVVAVGLAIGLVSSLSGLGAGLSLPVLAACGIPLPGALLAVKLPVAAGDLAQLLGTPGASIDVGTPDQSKRAQRMAQRLACGALGACASTVLPAGLFMALMALVVIVALGGAAQLHRQPRRSGLDTAEQTLWSVYIGGLGAAGGLLLALRARLCGHDWREGREHACQLGAAANIGAVLVLAMSQPMTQPLLMLALAQGLGAWAGRSLSTASLRLRTSAPTR